MADPLVIAALDRMLASVDEDLADQDPGNHSTIGQLVGEKKGLQAARELLMRAQPEALFASTTGWRLVPEEPDYSMELAGLEKLRTPNKDKSLNGVVTRIYRAMIYAAPQERSAEVPRQVDVESGKVDQTVDGHRDHVPSRGDESTPAGAAPTLLPPSPPLAREPK